MIKSIDLTNGQRFIDINIDSDNEESTSSTVKQQPIEPNNNNNDKTFLFKFKKTETNNSNNKLFNTTTATPTLTTATATANNSLTLNEATDILLSNLNELNLNFYSDDDHDDDDDDDEEDEEEEENKANLIQLQQKLQKIENIKETTTAVETFSNINEHSSTPLKSKSICSDENMNEISLNSSSNSSSDTNNRTLSYLTDNLMRKSSLCPNKDILTRFHSKNSNNLLIRNDSIMDGLLGDIYDRFNVSFKESFDSDVFTEISMSSARFSGTESRSWLDSEHESESHFYFKNSVIAKSSLKHLSANDLRELVNEMSTKVNQISAKLIKQLRQKDKLTFKLNRNCDILTALLQAKSLKRRVDTQMKFTLDPMPGENGFLQWKDAMKALLRLPGGIPKEFRKSVWLNLSQKYIKDINLDWNKVRRIAFNDRSNPDDDELGIQIVKDLHRTGCSAFSGDDNEQDRALLKRVLLAFARYNKTVGYCQGFNIIAALILEIVDKKEEDALICMIYLIDHVLPEGYFTNSMHTLAIDMAVFRELLKTKLPKLCQHLNSLQYNSVSPFHQKKNQSNNKTADAVSNYEPPLTNVFTMQWFLTLFATCLPKNVLTRVWDCIFLEGAEILFRTSIAIWDKLSISVMKAHSADAFYSMMSILTIKLFDQNVIDENDLINKIYSYGPFPLNGITELREKFTFSITPFQMFGLQQHQQRSKKSDSLSNLKLTNNNCGGSTPKTGTLINTENENDDPSVISLKKDLASLNQNEDLFALSLRQLNDNSKSNIENNDSKKNNSKKSAKNEYTENEYDDEVEDLAKMISCFALLMPNRINNSVTNSTTSSASATARNDINIMMTAAAAASSYGKTFKTFTKNSGNNTACSSASANKDDISRVTPGAFSYITQMHNPKPLEEHLTLDLNELKKQYSKLKERQRQAHVIIQTASNQHRLKKTSNSKISSELNLNTSNTNTTNASIINTNEAKAAAASSPCPFDNHLLMKPNDPQCNLFKKTIQINTNSNHMVSETQEDDLIYSNIIKTDLARHSSIESYEKEILEKKKSQPKKQIYYSDDEDDDEDYDSDNDNNENNTNINNNNKSQIKKNESNDIISFDEAKSLTLLDLSNLNEKHDYESNNNNNNNTKKELSSSSSSSTSSFESPIQSISKLEDRNNNYLYQLNDVQKIPKTKTSKVISSSIILNLTNEEKRHMAPLNPFPRHNRVINSNVAKNGMKLGLYKS